MSAPVWPSAEAVARAIVTAAGLEGDDPVLVAQGGCAPRARGYAFLALAHAFPTTPRDRIGEWVGSRGKRNFTNNVRFAVRGIGGSRPLDLARLNAVNAALGWPAMTHAEAEAATYAVVPALDNPPAAPAVDPTASPIAAQPIPESLPAPPKAQLPAVIPSPAAKAMAAFVRAKRVHRESPAPCVVTAALQGDPPPARSALNFSQPDDGPDGRERRAVPISPCGAAARDPDTRFVEQFWAAEFERRQAGG